MQNQNITELLLKAPLEIQDAVTSPEFGEKLEKIGEKHGLNISQMGVLADEIVAVLLQIKHADDVAESLKKELNLDDQKLVFLVADLNDEIFLPLRDVLYQSQKPEEIIENSEPPKTDSPVSIPIKTITEPLNPKTPEGLKPFAEPSTIPQPVIDPVVTHLGEKIETPDEILKHIEELPELPRPTAGQVVENVAPQSISAEKQNVTEPQTIKESAPVENKPQKAPDTRKYTVDPYREPIE